MRELAGGVSSLLQLLAILSMSSVFFCYYLHDVRGHRDLQSGLPHSLQTAFMPSF